MTITGPCTGWDKRGLNPDQINSGCKNTNSTIYCGPGNYGSEEQRDQFTWSNKFSSTAESYTCSKTPT
jgi:hypothetical protein